MLHQDQGKSYQYQQKEENVRIFTSDLIFLFCWFSIVISIVMKMFQENEKYESSPIES